MDGWPLTLNLAPTCFLTTSSCIKNHHKWAMHPAWKAQLLRRCSTLAPPTPSNASFSFSPAGNTLLESRAGQFNTAHIFLSDQKKPRHGIGQPHSTRDTGTPSRQEHSEPPQPARRDKCPVQPCGRVLACGKLPRKDSHMYALAMAHQYKHGLHHGRKMTRQIADLTRWSRMNVTSRYKLFNSFVASEMLQKHVGGGTRRKTQNHFIQQVNNSHSC